MKQAYVLMRIYNKSIEGLDKIDNVVNFKWSEYKDSLGSVECSFFNVLERAIKSVSINNAFLIICDDSSRVCINKWKEHNKRLLNILHRYNFKESESLFFVATQGKEGSAMASWRLRKKFLEITACDFNSYAVFLDQDDELYEGAIKKIGKKMGKNTIVVSSFQIFGEKKRDITSNGENRQHKLLKNLFLRKSLFPKLSSIGWTKSYSKSAMSLYVDDFETYFNNRNLSIEDYFRANKSYEDFLDFYILIRKDIKVLGNSFVTHKYYKHQYSITALPLMDDFEKTRPEMLFTLSNICQANSRKLYDNWAGLLESFLYIKICDIENILAKYRYEAEHGNLMMAPFKHKTYYGAFVDVLSFKYNDKYIINAIKLFENNCLMKLHQNKQSMAFDANYINMRYNWQKTPKQNQLDFYTKMIIILLIVFVIIIVFSIILILKSYNFIELSGGVITVIGTIITTIYVIRNNMKVNADKEISLKELYFSEFEDLIRHIEANLKVEFQLYYELVNNKNKNIRPSWIHFENIMWPTSSYLFNDDIAILINKSKINDFVRLRLNLRNMNNSAIWLKMYVDSSMYDVTTMIKMLEWEITRTIAYYVNFSYMKENQFVFASDSQLDYYLSDPVVKAKLKSLLMSASDSKKDKIIAYFLKKYFVDRRKKRMVILHC